MKIIVSDEADNDLLLIFSYLHQQSPQAAESIAGGDHITILGVLHGSRNIEAEFRR